MPTERLFAKKSKHQSLTELIASIYCASKKFTMCDCKLLWLRTVCQELYYLLTRLVLEFFLSLYYFYYVLSLLCKIERRKWRCKRGRKLKQQLNSPKTPQNDSIGNGAFTSHLAGPIAESLTPCFFHRKDMNGILKEMSFSLWEQQYLRRNSRNFSNNNIKLRFSADRTTVIWTSAKAQNQRLGWPMYL